MTRGAVVIFTCLLSVASLGRRQQAYHIAGVSMVFFGITLVSASTLVNPSAKADAAIQPASIGPRAFGIIFCVAAQVFQAAMLVYEESILSKYDVPPLRVVGMEGLFGILFGGVLLVGLNIFQVESTSSAVYQMNHSSPLFTAAVASIVSIAIFNFAGVTVTQ